MQHTRDSGVALSDAPSGFRQLVGYRISEWTEGAATVVLAIGPRHLNRSNIIHAGVLMTLLDTAGAYCGTYCAVPGNVRRSLTMSIDAKTFGTRDRGTLFARARMTSRDATTFAASAEVHDEEGTLVATGTATYRYQPGSEDPEGTPLAKAGEKRSTSLG
jgi:uncharacterized protein (TIGR00369 family)